MIKIFSLTKSRAVVLLIIIILLAFLTLRFSHQATFIEGEMYNSLRNVTTPYIYATYLYVENYILMSLLFLACAYFFFSFIYSIFWEKIYGKKYLFILLFELLLFFGFYYYVLGRTSYLDTIGIHVDKFWGLMLMLMGAINLIALLAILLFGKLAKNELKNKI